MVISCGYLLGDPNPIYKDTSLFSRAGDGQRWVRVIQTQALYIPRTNNIVRCNDTCISSTYCLGHNYIQIVIMDTCICTHPLSQNQEATHQLHKACEEKYTNPARNLYSITTLARNLYSIQSANPQETPTIYIWISSNLCTPCQAEQSHIHFGNISGLGPNLVYIQTNSNLKITYISRK